MDKKYNLKLDLQFRCNNSKMIFDEFDENTSDFFMQISRQGQEVDISNTIPTLLVLKPSGVAVSQILEVKNNIVYGNLKNSLKNEVGTYIAKLMLVEGDKKTFISNISYEVTENALLGKIDNDIVEDERYSVLIQLLERLSNIELQEQTRIDNENSRVEAENLRREAIEKIKNDIDNLINETKEELNEYKNNKDISINNDLKEFKENTNKSIENYKTSKDIEIDLYISEKNTLIDSKISEVDTAKEQLQNSVNSKLIEVDNAEKQRQEEHEERQQLLNGFEGKLNTVVDDVVGIKDDVVSVREANKRQDVFLQGLYNENLDGRVTVREEGSVISLINSADGLVDVAGLEGNTLVNYVQDGVKELTLNRDIDVEGTSVTLTEGVDNGLVDVACEGNTLVNCVKVNSKGHKGDTIKPDYSMIRPNTTYTFVFDISNISGTMSGVYSRFNNINGTSNHTNVIDADYINGRHISVVTTPSSWSHIYFGWFRNKTEGATCDFSAMVLEGDWTNKEIPTEYFEGMKSVGECEDNKIEIVSSNDVWHNKRFTRKAYIKGATGELAPDVSDEYCVTDFISVKPNTAYTRNGIASACYTNVFFDENKNRVDSINATDYSKPFTFTTPSNCKYVRFKFYLPIKGDMNTIYLIEGEGTEKKLNKKQITLPKPLRALPNGVCDKIVKIGGKWYVERNCGEVVLNGSENWRTTTSSTGLFSYYFIRKTDVTIWNIKPNGGLVADKIPNDTTMLNLPLIIKTGNDEAIQIRNDNVTSTNEIKIWLSTNPIEVIYELNTPIYEEITDPTVNTYTDTTHISNNSNIPCNMTIKNTGYNAIIKPSTQYTVAFDTDTSGTVGINLAGSKVTTNNNVATVTTPSTLVDDSLRLYGKGIKASNVRLLEGDKTNWIPSYFEGMKSSFEDKLQDDGTYKIEITSANTDNTLSNKIQFSSIEPLRGVGDVKDRFVFKDDGKLYIERNCAEITPSGDETWYYWDSNIGLNTDYMSFYMSFRGMNYKANKDYALISDILIDSNNTLYYRDLKSNSVALNGDKNISLQIGIKKSDLQTQDVNGFKQWLKTNKPRITYLLATPTYEEVPHELQKLILEGYENGTLFLDTNIPPTVTASYTANIPLVSKVNKVNKVTETNTEDIAITQMAVDFLLMSSLGEEMLNFKVKSGYNMASYFASRIIKGALKYEDVIRKYPNYKEDINIILVSEGYSDLIVEL